MSNEIRVQDEILQMLYWMKGEHIGDKVSREQINRFMNLPADEIDAALVRLKGSGLVRRVEDTSGVAHFQLTGPGLEQGKRRFADEFSSYLGKESHLECSDPNCDCHSPDFDGTCTGLASPHPHN